MLRDKQLTHHLAPYMSLPSEQDNVGIHVMIVVPESSYRRVRRKLSDGGNHCPVQFESANREKGDKDGLRHDVAKTDDTHAWAKVYRTSQALAFNMPSKTTSSSRSTSGTSPESFKASFVGSQSAMTPTLSHKSFEISVGSSSRVKFLRVFISSGM